MFDSQPLLNILHLHFSTLFYPKKNYKFKFDSVRQKCHGYGYDDMLEMDAF
jgi:hypothetical protein